MPNKSYSLNLTAGILRMDIAENDDEVVISYTGAKPLGFEKKKMIRFLTPVIVGYETDPRRVRIQGVHSPVVGHVVPGADGWWHAYATRRG